MSAVSPEVNTLVTLDVAGWVAPLRSRVEDIGADVTVAQPIVAPPDHDPGIGSAVTISWAGPVGPVEMPATLVAKEHGDVPIWRVRADGPGTIHQRRRHVRIGALLPVGLQLADGHRVDGHLVDLSEGGLRAVCRPVEAPLSLGGRLSVELHVEDEAATMAAEVVRVETDDERLHVGCRFLEVPSRQADRIRRFVFSRQIRERSLR